MNSTLKNGHILEAHQCLSQFNPKEIPFKCKRRLGRNLRKIHLAVGVFEQERNRIRNSNIVDKAKKPEAGQEQVALTVAEQITFHPEYVKLLNETQEVEIHTIELYDSKIEGDKPADPDHSIDISLIPPIPNHILAQLDEWMFVPAGTPSK